MECSEANVKKIKNCLSNILDKEESILEFATVKLSVCSPQTEKVFRSFIKEGILCVIINRNTSCLFLKLFELIQFHKVFEIELYTNISDGYTVRDNNFHIIEFPGFFLGLSFPIIENQNVSNRSSLIQKAIISISKFISINLSDYIYLHQFDSDKSSKKITKMKTYMKKGFKPQLSNDKAKFVKINESPIYGNEQGNNELLSNKIKFSANKDGQIELNESNTKNNNEFESISKMKSSNITSNNMSSYTSNQKDSLSDSNSSNSNNSQSKSNSNEENDNEIDSLSVTNTNNYERSSAYISSKDRNIKGILKKSISSNINNENKVINSNEKDKSTQIIIESKEKNLFDSITIEDSNDKKIYKIVQFHILKDKMKLVKKLFKKNFYRFISPDKISFDSIKEYKINTYDFLNDEDYSSEENEGQKTFVDYVPSNDMIGILENQQDIQDERLLELMQQKKNLKEISKKREDGIPIKTTSIYN